MKATDELMLIPDEGGFRPWRARGGVVALAEGNRGRRGADWVALPTKSLVSVPMRMQGVDGSRQESAALLELEAAGLGGEELSPHDFELRDAGGTERDRRASACIQVATLPAAILEEGTDARFAPAVAFRRLFPGEAQLWRESGSLVLAIPDDQAQLIHCQALSAHSLDADAAAEIRCILASLELGGLLSPLASLCIIAPTLDEDVVPVTFENALDVPVTVRLESPPIVPENPSRLLPASVVRVRQERSQRRMLLLGAAAFALVLIAALGAFAGRLALRERALIAEQARLDALAPELQEIERARAQWEELGQSIVPEDYPVELFHQLVLLLPPEGIRLTRFEINQGAIVLDGEASSLVHGIQFREALTSSAAFAGWGFAQGFPNPTSLPDGRATFHAEGRRDALLAGSEVPPP